MEELQQQTRENNIVITGMLITPIENMYMLLERLGLQLNIHYDRGDISAAHRLPGSDDTQPPSIVVCFISHAVNAEYLDFISPRRDPLLARRIHDSFPDTRLSQWSTNGANKEDTQ